MSVSADENLQLFWQTHLHAAVRWDMREKREEDRRHVLHALLIMDIKVILKLGSNLETKKERYVP